MSQDGRRWGGLGATARVLGWLLCVAGGLVVGVTGFFTLLFSTGGPELAGIAWAIGVLPMGLGGLLALAGVILLRSIRRWQG